MAARSNDQALGLRLLIAYKFAHGALFVALGIGLEIAARSGGDVWLRDLAVMLREHVMRAWSFHLADWLLRASSPHALALGALGLLGDGVFTLFEGWALHRKFRWAPWLVVVATSALLPVEIYELVQRVRIGRIVVLAVNVAVLLYLVQKTWKEHAAPPTAPR